MTINWFPGHMNKARRELAKALARIDVVIELLDARLPASSRNPMLAELRGDKPCITLLSKADLADPEATRAWLRALESGRGSEVGEGGEERQQSREGGGPGRGPVATLALDATRKGAARGLPKIARRLAPHRVAPGKTVRCMVVVIPNTGKSTLINTLVGRKAAKVGDRPAVTKSQQTLHLDGGISLSDTPGVLWPRLEDQRGAYILAASGAIRETAFDAIEVARFAVRLLAERYPAALRARFKIEALPEGDLEILEVLGRKRGFLRSGGRVDVERAAETLLGELRSGKVGRVSFETPEDAALQSKGERPPSPEGEASAQ